MQLPSKSAQCLIEIATYFLAAAFFFGCGSKPTLSMKASPKTIPPQVKNSPSVQSGTTSSDFDQLIQLIEKNEKFWNGVSRQNPDGSITKTTKNSDGSVTITITTPYLVLKLGRGQVVQANSGNFQVSENRSLLIHNAANWTQQIFNKKTGMGGGMGFF